MSQRAGRQPGAAEVGRVVDEVFRAPSCLGAWEPAADVLLTAGAVVVRLELAGVGRGDLRIRAGAARVVVSGARRDPLGPAPRRVDRMEIGFGPFARSLPLPAPVAARRARARLAAGFLEVVLPLAGPADDGAEDVEVPV